MVASQVPERVQQIFVLGAIFSVIASIVDDGMAAQLSYV
jgi:hypothetical protein